MHERMTMAQSAQDQSAPGDFKTCLGLINLSDLPFKERLLARLASLEVAFAEDYDGGRLSARSGSALVNFLQADRSFGYPDITATPSGDLYAEWRGSNGCKFAIEFLNSGDARFLLFAPNPKHPDRIDRLTGLTTSDALTQTIAPLAHLARLAA